MYPLALITAIGADVWLFGAFFYPRLNVADCVTTDAHFPIAGLSSPSCSRNVQ